MLLANFNLVNMCTLLRTIMLARARVFGGINFGDLVKNSPIRQIKIPAKVSGYTVYTVQYTGVPYIHSTVYRRTLYTQYSIQAYLIYTVQYTGVPYIHSTVYRRTLYTQYSIQAYLIYTVQYTGVPYIHSTVYRRTLSKSA